MTINNLLLPPINATILLFTILLSLAYFFPYESSLILEYNLTNMSATSINLPIFIDNISITFSITVILISMSVIIFTSSYINEDNNLNYFVWIVLIFVASINLLIFLPNLITLILGWDGLGLSSYLLVIFYLNNNSLGAGILTALTNRIGDALLILAIALAFSSSHWNFIFHPNLSNSLLVTLLLITAITNSAQIPFSAWLPAAMAAPTPVSALVHSSTLVTAGIYLIIRFYPTLSGFWQTNFICFYLGTLTCLMASSSASAENDLNNIIALSTLSQLGIIIIALGLSQPHIAFFHLITHALFNALLFICAGTIIHLESNNQDIRLIGNISSYSTLYIVFLNTANLSLCATPFLAGFYSNDSIVETLFFSSAPISTSIVIIISICITTLYTIRLSIVTLWSPNKTVNTLQYCSNFTYLPATILIVGAIAGGSFMSHYMMPIMISPTLPNNMNLLALTISLSFAIVISISFTKYNHIFITSIWLQTLVSSNLTSNQALNISRLLYNNEFSSLESLSGLGTNLSTINSTITINNNDSMLTKIVNIVTILGILTTAVILLLLICLFFYFSL